MKHDKSNHGLRNSALLLTFGIFAAPLHALNDQKVFALDGATNDSFGIAAAEGSTLLVGAPADDDLGAGSGSAYVFEKDSNDVWNQVQKLIPADSGPGDAFGSAVAISGDALLVGSTLDDDRGTDAGAAYLFRRSGTTWYQEAKLTASNGVADDFFGSAVALENGVAVIGAYHNGLGKAYVFRDQGGGNWTQEQQLSSDFGLFGFSVAIGGGRIAIGGYDAVAVYERPGSYWQLQAMLVSPDGPGSVFGVSVAIDDQRLVAGAWLDDQVADNAGAAFVFGRQGTSWNHEAKLTAADGGPSNFFGGHVALEGDRILVGAHADDDLGQVSGSAYVFVNESGLWGQEQKLLAPNGTAWDAYGGSVALTPAAAFVGAGGADGAAVDSGAVFVTCFPEPLPELFDILPGRVTSAAIATNQLEVTIDYSLLLGGEIVTPSLQFYIDVYVNGSLRASELVTEYLALGIPACYTSAVPCVAGGCPGSVRCVWVDLPGTFFDYCACDWIGSLVVQVPGRPGNLIEVVIDASDSVSEVREENNFAEVVAGDIGNNYCVGAPNSTGQEATITALGSAVAADNNFKLSARGLPANAINLFLMGTSKRFVPFGDGYRCVGAPVMRIPPPAVANGSGVTTRELDLSVAPWSDVILPGSTWRFQNWYRDSGTANGFNLSDATAVAFATGNVVRPPEVNAESAFQDPNAHVVGGPVTHVSEMVGSQMFLKTATHGRVLVEIAMIELFTDPNGVLELGYLEGSVVWGDAPFEGLVIDRLDHVLEHEWTPLSNLGGFQTGLPGSNGSLAVEQLVFHRVLVNEYLILMPGELYGTDLATDTAISTTISTLAAVDCRSSWDWECVNTACGGNCEHYETQPNGKVKLTCECRSVGGCTWLLLPNCRRVNCASNCDLFGFWDFCDC